MSLGRLGQVPHLAASESPSGVTWRMERCWNIRLRSEKVAARDVVIPVLLTPPVSIDLLLSLRSADYLE